jgi:hypothetical protein
MRWLDVTLDVLFGSLKRWRKVRRAEAEEKARKWEKSAVELQEKLRKHNEQDSR